MAIGTSFCFVTTDVAFRPASTSRNPCTQLGSRCHGRWICAHRRVTDACQHNLRYGSIHLMRSLPARLGPCGDLAARASPAARSRNFQLRNKACGRPVSWAAVCRTHALGCEAVSASLSGGSAEKTPLPLAWIRRFYGSLSRQRAFQRYFLTSASRFFFRARSWIS